MLLALVALFTVSCSSFSSSDEKFIITFNDEVNTTTLDTDRDYKITVHAQYDDNSVEDVTDKMIWTSSAESIATVVNGTVQTNSTLGDVTITCATKELDSSGNPFYEKNYDFSVKPLILKSIELNPTTLSIITNYSSNVIAKGTFEDSVTKEIYNYDITNNCNWTSSNTSIATVDNGVVSAIKEGNTTITATDSNISVTLPVEVTTIHYSKITLESTTREFNVEQTISLVAKGVLVDTNKTVVISDAEIKYTSNDATVVKMDSSIATAIAKGSAIITATMNNGDDTIGLINLAVNKDNYVRLFKNDVEVSLPYNESDTYTKNESVTYKLKAVGSDFTITDMSIKTVETTPTDITGATFDGISDDDILYSDKNVSFSLNVTNTTEWDEYSHRYYFSFDDNTSFTVDLNITR